jgi:anti-sigma B factor antagonist
MSNFSVKFRQSDSIQILELEGDLDAHTAPDCEAAIRKCRDDAQHRIIVHGTRLEYISSAGLGVFMAFIEEVREGGGDIKITELQPRVYNVFDLLGFPVLFDILETEADAITKFGEAAGDS